MSYEALAAIIESAPYKRIDSTRGEEVIHDGMYITMCSISAGTPECFIHPKHVKDLYVRLILVSGVTSSIDSDGDTAIKYKGKYIAFIHNETGYMRTLAPEFLRAKEE